MVRRFYKFPYNEFNHYLEKEWVVMAKGERHARTGTTLKQLGIILKPEFTSDKAKSVPVRGGAWVCMPAEKERDGEWRPCFNHLYSKA